MARTLLWVHCGSEVIPMVWIVVAIIAVVLIALAWWTSGPRFSKGQRRADGTDSVSHPYNKYGTGGGSAGSGGG
jgi:hypothetical protein